MLLLLGSLSLHTASLQGRLRVAALQRQRVDEDALASAAHHLVGRLNGAHRCLLALPLAEWAGSGLACADPAAQAALLEAEVLGHPYRLVEWRPGAAAAEVLLELRPAAPRPPRRAAFWVALAAGDGRAVDLRLLGLRGIRP